VFAIIHEGLKIRRGQPHGGSIPPPGTNKKGTYTDLASHSREAKIVWWLFWWLLVLSRSRIAQRVR
jgi:hypothetical protein